VGVFVYLPDWVQKNSRIVVGEPAEDNGESIEESGLIEAEQEPAVEENDDGSMPQRVSAPAVPGGDPEVEDRSATKPSREQIAALPEPGNSPDRPVDRPPTTRPMTVPPRPASPGASESGRAFSKAMSDGLRGLDNRDFIAAEKSFQAALKLRPDSREATDGLARARQKVRLEAIERHGAKAKQLVDAERWREAEAEFRAVLEIDPTIRFAMVGQQQASQRADLSDRLDFHLANPDRMSSLKVLNEAINLLDRARNAVPDGPRIQQQISLLEQAVEVASTPIRIRLVSDNNTEVVVYRVGSLGKFEQHQLDLRPGSYTVVGSRDGYRDVRRVLKVGPGQSTEPVVVRCEEKI
jgi:tetratricopeptide (TPR) repeat protein